MHVSYLHNLKCNQSIEILFQQVTNIQKLFILFLHIFKSGVNILMEVSFYIWKLTPLDGH